MIPLCAAPNFSCFVLSPLIYRIESPGVECPGRLLPWACPDVVPVLGIEIDREVLRIENMLALVRPFFPAARGSSGGSALPRRGLTRAAPNTKRQRFYTCSANRRDGAARVVFLGTPAVAAASLRRLNQAAASSHDSDAPFRIAAVVTQPPAPVGRKRVLTPSPVHSAADEIGVSEILTPASARDDEFLSRMNAIAPDLCVTAAYGNFLPQRFLDVPTLGTLNIHPSLLPKYRGAAPVPRALEAGDSETGVSVAYTVLKMDSGPILRQETVQLKGDEQGPELLSRLFALGTDMLVSAMPVVLRGDGMAQAVAQDGLLATAAPKLSKSDGRLTFTENSAIVHNKVRAYAGWPGTWADFVVADASGSAEEVRLKIIRTSVLRRESGMCLGVHDIRLSDDASAMMVTCDDGSAIEVLEVQPPGKKPMPAAAFWNGLRGKSFSRKRVPH